MIRRKRRTSEAGDAVVPLPGQLRARLELVSRHTGSSANSLILQAITRLLDQLEPDDPEAESLPDRPADDEGSDTS